eukprot:Seg10820.1 transcript_id=Seg10820.1/GoldUCD/mRNA.D3Y31 product="hypothetical protein" protein_id=Seg10820.1/GoldUCD/D3Y31
MFLREELHLNVVEMWEHEWDEITRTNLKVKQFISERMLPTEKRLFFSMDEAIRMIGNGKLFGFCEVDIETPENKKEYFAEMCLIFKNDEVGVEDIGEYMQEFAPNDKMKRRLLIGSYYGKKIGLATPLLKWNTNQPRHSISS